MRKNIIISEIIVKVFKTICSNTFSDVHKRETGR